jgi:hypothetical protein
MNYSAFFFMLLSFTGAGIAVVAARSSRSVWISWSER